MNSTTSVSESTPKRSRSSRICSRSMPCGVRRDAAVRAPPRADRFVSSHGQDKASTRKPRRRNARARDDGGTRRATEATPPVRASKRLSVQVSAAASAFLVNFRLRLDAIASIFVNYHEEREALVEKTEAADLIEQNVAEMMGVVYRGASRLLIQFVVLPRKMGTGRDSLESDENVVTCFIDAAATLKRARKQGLLRPVAPRPLNARVAPTLQFDFVLMLCRRLGVKDVFLFATEAGAPAWLTLGFEHVGSSASLIHLRFDLLFKRDRGVLALRPRSRRRAAAARWTARSRSSATPRASTPWSAVQERVAEYGEKQVVRLAKEAANAAAEAEAENDVPAAREVSTDAPEHDSLAAPSPPRASSAPAPAAPSPPARVDSNANTPSPPPREAAAAPTSPEAAGPLEAAPPAPAPRRRAAASKKRVVDDADADDEDEAWEPGRPSNMDLDDDEQEQAAKAKRKLKRRSKKKSAKAKNAAGAAPHAPEQERNAFLERIQAEEVRREQARIAAARPVPPPPNRATGADDDSDEGWEESDEDDPVEDLIHRERIRERDLLRTPGCLALGRKAFRLEDMPRTAPSRAEVQIKELGFHFVDPLAPIAEKEIVPRVRVFIPYLGIEGWISITSRGPALDDGHLIVELKYLQAMHVKNRMLKKCCYTLYLLELADRLRGEASRETLKTARKNVVEVRSRVREPAPTLNASSP
ncbi:hypothetical protein JL720_1520 [Aureococcus anophagefferens]|nr:hypothetical protein JL720_1520 [Aureococcus anophagefferens]